MACSPEEPCGLFLAPFPGTLCINYFQTESIGQDGLSRWDLCADCAQHVCDGVADPTVEQKSRRKRSIFDAAPRGPLEAKMPECCGTPLAQMFILWCEQSKPGDKLFLGVAHMDRHARVSLQMLCGATGSTSLLSPSAGMLQGLSPGGTWWTRPSGWRGPVCPGAHSSG